VDFHGVGVGAVVVVYRIHSLFEVVMVVVVHIHAHEEVVVADDDPSHNRTRIHEVLALVVVEVVGLLQEQVKQPVIVFPNLQSVP
jgi:hypothetical protein